MSRASNARLHDCDTVMARDGLALLALLATAVWPAGPAHAQMSWTDPVAYCRAIGTIDVPDARYVGPDVPDWMARSLMRAVHAPADAPIRAFRHAAWRCMDGAVLACSPGANIPCDQKANASRMPSRGARRYCAHNPSADVVPAYATGRATVFEWRCAAGDPVAARQVLAVDERGFASAFWHQVEP